MNKIKQFWIDHPLKSILLLALLGRFIAVLFAKGYGFHDDHFLVIDAAQSWLKHYNWNEWFPRTQKIIYPNAVPSPEGHNLLYAGAHYVLFMVLNFLGINNPQIEMYIVRLLHALASLLVVLFGYKITLHYTNEKIARQSGLLLALLWFMPFFSVRNLVETATIPFLMWGLWIVVKNEFDPVNRKAFLIAGLLMGLAFSLRYQTLVFAGGVGLVLLFRKQWKPVLSFALGVFISIALIQGVIDLFIWGRPFAEVTEYIRYNILHRNEYGHNIWYMYTSLLLGMIIIPLGIFLFVGWFATIRKFPLLFWPAFLFYMFHNLYPNKQERFILSIVPIYIIAGVVGWWLYMDKSAFWQKSQKLFKGFMVFFWIVNMILLSIVSTTYSKKSRCETMVYLAKLDDAHEVISEETNRSGVTMFPNFYAGKDITFYDYPAASGLDSARLNTGLSFPLHNQPISSPAMIAERGWPEPQYVLFINEKDVEKRIENFKTYYPNIEYVTTIQPGYIDLLMKRLTPSNNNQSVAIYRILH